jgi:hypothetical protein
MWMQVENELGSDPVPWIFVTLIPRGRAEFERLAVNVVVMRLSGGSDVDTGPSAEPLAASRDLLSFSRAGWAVAGGRFML